MRFGTHLSSDWQPCLEFNWRPGFKKCPDESGVWGWQVVCYIACLAGFAVMLVAVGADPREAEALVSSWNVADAGQRGGRRGSFLDG